MYYKMVVITVEKYENAGAHTITVKNKKLLWVKMRMCKKDWVYKICQISLKKYGVFLKQKTLQ